MATKETEKVVAKSGGIAPILFADVQRRIVSVRGQSVILDADVAALYGVETKRVNEVVRNNSDKFPEDYMFALTDDEVWDLRPNNSVLQRLQWKLSA